MPITFFFDLLIRAWTGSFANVWQSMRFENIKLGHIFGPSKNGSWALVNARNFFFDLLIESMHRKLWRCAKIHFWALAYFDEVGHSTKCCHLVTINFFGANFSRTLIRACTGSFANVWRGVNLENIKLGQIFGSSKNGSGALVDARNFFFWFINWEHAQEALEMCQNTLLGFGLLWGSRS